ncbi:MAG: hypothetical protein ACYC5M_03075 [Anaerolineae bacterium]
MTTPNPRDPRATSEQILDLLLDALLERQAQRRSQTTSSPANQAPAVAATAPFAATKPQPATTPVATAAPLVPRKPEPGDEDWKPLPAVPEIGLRRTLGRLMLLIVALVVLVNAPIARYGVNLAHLAPEAQALVIRDGLVVKGSGPEIYRLEADKLRWISSMEAFEHMGLRWEDVHTVDDDFLASFEKGQPIHVLLKCQGSPHIYRLEGGLKRWIRDIPTFEAEGHVWEDVRTVACEYLAGIPDGPPIPEDAGNPPS